MVDRGANGDLAVSDVILWSRFDRKVHPPDNMDYSIDSNERSQLDPHFDELGDYINRPVQMPSTLGFLMKQHLISTDQVLNVPRSNEPVATHTIFTDTLEVAIDVQQTQEFMERDCLVTDIYPMTSGKHFVNTLETTSLVIQLY